MDIVLGRLGVRPLQALARGVASGRSGLRFVAVLVVTPCAVEAQAVTREEVDSALAAYVTRYQDYQTTKLASDELAGMWEGLNAQLQQAREREDESEESRLLPEIQDLAEEREGAGAELRRVEELWRETGNHLIQTVVHYQLALSDRLETVDEGARNDILRELEAMSDVRRGVEEQMGPREPLVVPTMPAIIRALPERTPTDLRRKAASYRDFADQLDRYLVEVDEEIARLRTDQQRENQMQAFLRDPLGIRRVPVRTGDGGSGAGGADTTEVDLTGPTLEQQIGNLLQTRELIVDERDRALAEADELDRRAGGGP